MIAGQLGPVFFHYAILTVGNGRKQVRRNILVVGTVNNERTFSKRLALKSTGRWPPTTTTTTATQSIAAPDG